MNAPTRSEVEADLALLGRLRAAATAMRDTGAEGIDWPAVQADVGTALDCERFGRYRAVFSDIPLSASTLLYRAPEITEAVVVNLGHLHAAVERVLAAMPAPEPR